MKEWKLTSSRENIPRFIVDNNVGKLARWLRMMGYDALFFDGPDDWDMVRTALAENRVIITRDTRLMERRIITSGKVGALLMADDNPEKQIRQVITTLDMKASHPLSRCLECNTPLLPRRPDEVAGRVPPYVFRTQKKYVECPACHRIYWQGTHWQAMQDRINLFQNISERQRKFFS